MFAASGASAALAGVLLSYSLGAASPVALSRRAGAGPRRQPLSAVFRWLAAVARRWASRPACSRFASCAQGSARSASSRTSTDIVTGLILVTIAVLDAPDLTRRFATWRLDRAERRAS